MTKIFKCLKINGEFKTGHTSTFNIHIMGQILQICGMVILLTLITETIYRNIHPSREIMILLFKNLISKF